MGMSVDALMDRVGAPGSLQAALSSGWTALARWGVRPAEPGDSRDFFAAADSIGPNLRAAGHDVIADEVAFHAAYLARRRALNDRGALAETVQPDDAPAREAIWNIASLLMEAPPAPGQTAPPARIDGVPDAVRAVIEAAERQLEGWCTREKALALARLVLRERPQVCVEIGVYGGRSLMPCAAALRANGAGRIYGIEAWSNATALRHATQDTNDCWWRTVDFARIKRGFFRFVVDQDLSAQICLLETDSRRAAAAFEAIDFLHIDGGHSVLGAAEDVLHYAAKVRPGGIIVFDDTDWDTTLPAQHLLAALAQPLMTDDQVNEAHYAIYRRG